MNEHLIQQFYSVISKIAKSPTQEEITRMTRGEAATLVVLVQEQNHLTSGELSKRLHVSSGRMADTLKSLEMKGFIQRTSSPTDKRQTLVSYTEEGKVFLETLYQDMQAKLMDCVSVLGEQDTQELLRIVEKLINARLEKEEAHVQ